MINFHHVVLSNFSLQFLGQFFGLELFDFLCLHKLSVFIVITSNNKLSLNRQLLSTEAKSLFGCLKRNTFNLEEDASGSYRSNPSCGVTFTFTHTYISRLAGDRFVGEDADPYLTFTVHITVDSNTGCLNLTAVNPLGVKCLDTERTEGQLRTSVSVAFIATSILRSSISYSLRL